MVRHRRERIVTLAPLSPPLPFILMNRRHLPAPGYRPIDNHHPEPRKYFSLEISPATCEEFRRRSQHGDDETTTGAPLTLSLSLSYASRASSVRQAAAFGSRRKDTRTISPVFQSPNDHRVARFNSIQRERERESGEGKGRRRETRGVIKCRRAAKFRRADVVVVIVVVVSSLSSMRSVSGRAAWLRGSHGPHRVTAHIA